MKTCITCGVSKELSEFYRDSKRKDGLGTYCKPCNNAKRKAWRVANKNRSNAIERRRALKRNYGITPCELTVQLIAQNGRCAICKAPEPTTGQGWMVDHDHDTGAVRGILCHHCNMLLGGARDSAQTLLNAVDYLNTKGAWRPIGA